MEYQEVLYSNQSKLVTAYGDDVVNELHIKVLEGRLNHGVPHHQRMAYVHRVARSIRAEIWRRESRRRQTQLDDSLHPAVDQQPSRLIEREETLGLVRQAVASLRRADAHVVNAHYFNGQRIEEIARALGESQSCIKMRLARARKLLRPLLIDCSNAA